MTQIAVVPFKDALAEGWDRLVQESVNGTFMHTRRFLNYHGDRFEDASLLFTVDDSVVAVLPAAVDPDDHTRVASHPGLTYGGLVRLRRFSGEDVVDALGMATEHYAGCGFRELRYKPSPLVFHRVPAADDSYALQRLGGIRYRCDLSSVIALADTTDWRNHNRRRGQKKALKAGVTISEDLGYLGEYWDVLEGRLLERHGVRPVHTLEEISLIASLFPDQFTLVTGLLEGRVVAGVVLFRLGEAMHVQYSGSTAAGREVGALSPVTWHAVQSARAQNAWWLSFGVSTEDEGRRLNASLFHFKESFGAGGVVHEHFALPLG